MGRRKRRGGRTLDAVLLVDKPQGPTSFDVVQRVRRALNVDKAGHCGTLDPMATGLLVICTGRATRLVQYLTGRDKSYTATVKLGVATDTLDAEGTVTRTDAPEKVAAVDADAFEAALAGFRGPITQTPPMYSAIKIDGRPLYERARAGEVVEVPSREVTIFELTASAARPPDFDFAARCSKGTYVRTLAADIAGTFDLGGHLTALRRTAIGDLPVSDAMTLAEIEADPEAAVRTAVSMANAISWMPSIELEPDEVLRVRQGKRLQRAPIDPGLHRALDADGHLVALMEPADEGLKVHRGFPPPSPVVER